MTTMTPRIALGFIAGIVMASFGTMATAASTWNFSTCNGTSANQTGSSYGNSWSCAGSVAGNKVTVSAYGGADSTGSTGFQTAYVSNQRGSGFGIASRYETLSVSTPDHAADNSPANKTPDLFLLKFDSAIALDTVTLGWNKSDADFTLMAYKGVAPTITGKIASDTGSNALVAGTGWSLVQNVGDAATALPTSDSSTDIIRTVNQANVVSSWWLISAYSAGYGAGSLDTTLDYFKLFSVASKDVTTSKVPEPGSIALLGLGLVGMVAARRRKQASM